MTRTTGGALLVALLVALAEVASARAPATSCELCHGNSDFFDEADVARAQTFTTGVHAARGLSCHDCHGGNPDPSLAEDLSAAMDASFEGNPYRGVPERKDVPGFCGSCHSDPVTMRRYRPDARVDQEREYWTSRHGEGLAQGDTRVAICTDCHGSHGILSAEDRSSPVHPMRVAETCAGCHADADTMAGYHLADGSPLPVNQYALWRRSVHARSLLEREDLSAPTCNDCHANHGAVPPGVDSIAFVCGQCHRREAELFRASPKHEGFELHNEYLAGAGAERCAACHDATEPAGRLESMRSFGECSTCHGNHGVMPPSVALLSPLPETPCAFCHEGTEAPSGAPAEDGRERYQGTLDALLAQARGIGLEGDGRFDWLVDRVHEIPFHTHPAREEGAPPQLRPEMKRMFEKFRIGKTQYEYPDPVTGLPAHASLIRCSHCHPADGAGGRAAGELLERMGELTVLTARAERTLARARLGGVQTRPAFFLIDQAVDSQIELEALVHAFSLDPEGPFLRTQQEGLGHARAALAAADAALAELASRRRGLALVLFVVFVVLVSLALKIRSLG